MNRKRIDHNNLFTELKKGNHAAIEYLFKMFRSSMCYYAESLIKDWHNADIIYTDVFNNHLLPAVGSFNSTKTVQSYLYDAIRDACIKFLKERKEEQSRLVEYLNTTEKIVHPEDEMKARLKAEILQEVIDHVDKLPQERRIVGSLLFFCDEKSKNKEIAEMLNISPQAVSKIKREIIEDLIQTFSDRLVYKQHYWLIMKLNLYRSTLFDTE